MSPETTESCRLTRHERSSPFRYQPALDGVRAVAVAMVLCFHAGFGWMSGGYVGVSVFFTLSGYLITSLALVEHDRCGRIDVVAFYSRGEGMIQWSAEHLDVMRVSVSAAVGCGLNASGLLPDDSYRETCVRVRSCTRHGRVAAAGRGDRDGDVPGHGGSAVVRGPKER